MEAVIERLRVSKEQFLEEETERGKKQGRYWAQERANYSDLLQLSKLETEYLENYRDNKNDTVQAIREVLEMRNVVNQSDFVDRIFGTDAPITAEFWIGWVEGAQEVFSEVEDQL